MEIVLIILAVLILLGIVILFFRTRQAGGGREMAEKMIRLEERLRELNEKSGEQTRVLDNKLAETHRTIQEQHGQSARLIRDITERLTKLDETNKNVLNFTDQLQNLQDILKNPKQRGVLGEYYLEETLKNVLPPNSYQMQYKFKDGEIVDAAVFVKEKIIPVDSKFTLENYERILNAKDENIRNQLEKQFKLDLKNRIDETAKYVRPKENTMDFAFMFIPSESIYYDLLINKVGAVKIATRDLIEYAFKEKHVIIVSPTSFLAYLQTVLQGLRALQIEESAKEIRKNVESLAKHILNYEDYLKKLGQHLGTAVNSYNTAYHEFKKIDKDVYRISGKKANVEPKVLAKPKEF